MSGSHNEHNKNNEHDKNISQDSHNKHDGYKAHGSNNKHDGNNKQDSHNKHGKDKAHDSHNKHAVLSASGAHRWLKCLPSAILEKQFPNKTSVYAEEGTAAHNLAEHKLKKALKLKSKKPTSKFGSEEMEEFTDVYVEYCLSLIEKEKCQDVQVLIEQRLDFSDYVPGGFGTGDLVVVGDSTLHVVDLKYGKGVMVSAEQSPQMMLYALGALSLFEMLYDIEKVSMHIVQPRVDNFSIYEMSADGLMKWAENELKPKAVIASKGEGEFCPGDHCRFCRAKNQCRSRAAKNLEQLKHDFKAPPLLSDDEIEEIISVADEISKWASDVYTYATACSVNQGKKWNGFKLVQGRSNRKYTDEKAVAKTAIAAGYNDIYKQRLITITQMEKLMGKKIFNDILGSLVVKPQGKLSLVPETDKRQEVDPVISDFN